jgi:hypothetical protein
MASKRKLKKRIRKLEARSSGLPKRMFGVKIPKKFRRTADSRIGSDILAATIVAAGAAALKSPAAERVRKQAQAFLLMAAHSASNATQAAASRVSNALRDSGEEADDVNEPKPAPRRRATTSAGTSAAH